MNVPNIAKFLNSQTFNSEYEEKSHTYCDFIKGSNLAYQYAFDKKNHIVVYLLCLPICNY